MWDPFLEPTPKLGCHSHCPGYYSLASLSSRVWLLTHIQFWIVPKLRQIAERRNVFVSVGSTPGQKFWTSVFFLFFFNYRRFYVCFFSPIFSFPLYFSRHYSLILFISTISRYIISNLKSYNCEQTKWHNSSSSSCHAASTDIPDPLSPLLPIVFRLWQVFRATSRILTELLYVCSSWSSCFCTAICGGSIGVHHLCACPCFSRSLLHVWYV